MRKPLNSSEGVKQHVLSADWVICDSVCVCLSGSLSPSSHVKKRITIISTSIACLWLKPIFLGRAVWVWECTTVSVCQPSAALLWVFRFWDMYKDMGLQQHECSGASMFFWHSCHTPGFILLFKEAEGDVWICVLLLSRLIRNGESRLS